MPKACDQSNRHRLDDPCIQRAFRRLHDSGPRPMGMFVLELLNRLGADPGALDLILEWQDRWGPELIDALGGGDFPRCPLRIVPPPMTGVAAIWPDPADLADAECMADITGAAE